MKLFCCILFIFLATVNAMAQQSYWQQRVDNVITATLNDKDHTLDGFIKISYTNNSPDTLTYIWFHLWPNAYKNDRTAFSEQMLEMGNTKFYFSAASQKGYINQLDFRVNDTRAVVQDHPVHQDIVQVILPAALTPQQTVLITTPFHVKLPDRFSRLGHDGQSYAITQWYPKPAVYDRRGWHPMPYLAQGEFYSEFGNFNVSITLPENYVVAATGQLQNTEELNWLKTRAGFTWQPVRERKKVKGGMYKTVQHNFPASSSNVKTLQYTAENVHDFAWFADKRFAVTMDTCLLASGEIINTYAYCLPAQKQSFANVQGYLKKALRFYSDALGQYPYPAASVVQGFEGMNGGMEYPMLGVVQSSNNQVLFEKIVAHETGHNWLYGVLASNEREHAWMDEGMTTFYDRRYSDAHNSNLAFWRGMTPEKINRILLESAISVKTDQPVDLSAQEYSAFNYGLSVYTKASLWMKLLEERLGQVRFDSAMQRYYSNWQFKHPYPEDFKSIVDKAGDQNNDSLFASLSATGRLTPPAKKQIRLTLIGKPDETGKYHYIGIAPALGYNYYDQLMVGGIVHNYSLPLQPFKFVVLPLYATGSKQLNGIARVSYTWYPQNVFYSVEAGASGALFTRNTYTDSAGHTNYLRFNKVAPYLRFTFRNRDVHSQLRRYIQLKYYLIGEDNLSFGWDSVEMKSTYSVQKKRRSLGQIRLVTENYRALYPYKWELQLEAGKSFGRIAYTGNYFFNYPKGGGMNVRGFAGKFFYLGNKSSLSYSDTYPYYLNMTAPKGEEDYTYSNYFVGRNEFDGFLSQQVMMRDGGFKVRTDFLSNKVGKTDNWLLAANFTSTIHPKLPVKLFFDAGTSSNAWESESDEPRLLFDAGVQLSLFKDILNIYVPVIYSKVYRDYFRSTPGNNFWQRISFSIDIQHINFKKFHPLLPF